MYHLRSPNRHSKKVKEKIPTEKRNNSAAVTQNSTINYLDISDELMREESILRTTSAELLELNSGNFAKIRANSGLWGKCTGFGVWNSTYLVFPASCILKCKFGFIYTTKWKPFSLGLPGNFVKSFNLARRKRTQNLSIYQIILKSSVNCDKLWVQQDLIIVQYLHQSNNMLEVCPYCH